MGTRRTSLAVLIIGGLLVGACSTSPTVQSGGGAGPGTSTPNGSGEPVYCPDVATYAWYGISKQEAINRAESQGRDWRIAREDDETFALTEDHVIDRVTLSIDDGRVTFASVEQEVGLQNEGAQDPADVEYVGLTRAEAEAKAASDGIPARTVRVNDESFVVTLDYSEDRLNFEIDGEAPCDLVTVITRG